MEKIIIGRKFRPARFQEFCKKCKEINIDEAVYIYRSDIQTYMKIINDLVSVENEICIQCHFKYSGIADCVLNELVRQDVIEIKEWNFKTVKVRAGYKIKVIEWIVEKVGALQK